MELVVVRHGETEWTISGQYTGCTEMTLTSNGRRQAASLRRILNSVLRTRTPVAYSSPRERAPETARLALPDARARIDSALSEFDHGSYEGLTPTEVTDMRPSSGSSSEWMLGSGSDVAVEARDHPVQASSARSSVTLP